MKRSMKPMHQTVHGGFSLIEMIVAITVLGILSASAAVFLRGPITSYFDAERRADMSDSGGLAMAKLSQEISRAVPNSVRVTTVGTSIYLEFLPVISEGRYRSVAPGNALNDGSNSFDALGFPINVAAGNAIVVNSHLGSVWSGGNPGVRAAGVVGVGNPINHAPHTFLLDPNPNPEHRFQVAGAPVTYVCAPNPANPVLGTLRRYSGYAIQAAQPVNAVGAPLAGAQNDLLATNIMSCGAAVFPGMLRRAQVVTLALNFDNAGDRLNLAHTIRVEPLP